MTDKELLGLAAKAAGINNLVWWDAMTSFQIEGPGEVKLWNPLTDDGDALRLTVKLGLVITPNYHAEQQSLGVIEFTGIEDSPDPYAPTRRAIVRAAAEIGKKMP